MIDIQLIENDTKVRFHKKFWAPNELIIAECFYFTAQDDGVLIADIRNTHRQPLYEFIRIAFKNFSESPMEVQRRESFYVRLEASYKLLNEQMGEIISSKLPYAQKLYVHQWEAVRFAFHNRCNFLALQMRLGKSIVSASLSRIFNLRRTVILCPSVAKMGWFRDLTGFWGFNELYFSVLDATKSKTFIAFQERFVVLNYDIIENWLPHLLHSPIDHIIIDEAHKIKSRKSRRFKLVEQLVINNPQAKITFLSGSPIANRFNDLFTYFNLSGHRLGGSYTEFVNTFTTKEAGIGGEKITGAKNINDLRVKMSNFMHVKTMAECFDMPEDIVSRYTFEMDDYRPEYEKIIEEMRNQNELSALNGSIHSLNILTCKSKIPGIIELLEDIIEQNGKVVVFGTYKEPLQMLQDHFKERCLKIVGGVSSYDRDQYKQRFHSDPSVQAMLCNFEAGGEALDLSVADDIVYINFPFTVREMEQSSFRIKHPEKRGKHIRKHLTFCEDSVDEHIYNIVIDKNIDINNLLHNGKDVMKRENITEVLIKSILNKNDINFKIPHAKTVVVAQEEKVEEVGEGLSGNDAVGHRVIGRYEELLENSQEGSGGYVDDDNGSTGQVQSVTDNNQGTRIERLSTPDGIDEGQAASRKLCVENERRPQYHLIVHHESDCMFIWNQEEFDREPKNIELECVFSSENIDEVFMEIDKCQILSDYSFNGKYTPNPDTIPVWPSPSAIDFITPPDFL